MKFKLAHTNFNVMDLDRSIAFYEKALGLHVVRRKKAEDERFELAFLSDDCGRYQLELTWLRDRTEPYDLGDNETHVCFQTDDFAAAHALHTDMGCICFENEAMGLYFINDPDDYWLEIVPLR
ncbi:MAG: lactoylglutathione lyase [Clostridiaceae bacterium]|jgi:lactoylglutathione lyase|nr:VOC family protein [Eubacteriales bacterium]NLV48850.1 lactoylglutathione lyase [Clostridiaceae bacterium]